MKFVAIEYDYDNNSNHTKGYLRIPEEVTSAIWMPGYMNYIADKGCNNIHVYPLNIHQNSDTMGKAITGYENLEDEFNLALRSNKYFPISPNTDFLRRAWSKMDPESPDFGVKER